MPVLHNLEAFSVAVCAFTVLECTLAVLHNLHASPDSFSERAADVRLGNGGQSVFD